MIQLYWKKIKKFKGVGTITVSGVNSFMYRVRSLNDLNNIILPHFSNYPLKTQKLADFILSKLAMIILQMNSVLYLKIWSKHF